MQSFNFAVIRWTVWHWIKQFSLPFVLGVCLLAAGVLSYGLGIIPMLAAIEENELRAAQQAQLKPDHTTIVQAEQAQQPLAMAAKLGAFYAKFPAPDALPDLLAQINIEAQAHHLTLDRGDYKLKRLKTKKVLNASSGQLLVQYEIMLPIQGGYQNIRAFMNQILQTLPMLAITDVQMQRDRIEGRQIEASLRMVLFFNEAAKDAG